MGEEADGLQAGRQGMGVESVFYTRRDSIQPRPCPYLSILTGCLVLGKLLWTSVFSSMQMRIILPTLKNCSKKHL